MDVATIMEAAGQEISLGTVEGMTAQKEEVLDTSTVQSFQATETDPLPVVEGPDDAPVEVEDDQDVPEEASGLANLIQAQVGEYQLAGQEVNQPMLDAGAVEAIQLGYVRVSDEAFTLHGIELWQDEATAASVNSERAMYLANQGLEPIGSVDLTGSDGSVIGTAQALQGTNEDGSTFEVVAWNNLRISVWAIGPDAIDFFNNLPY